MWVYCKSCGGEGRIVSSDALSLEFARLYCQCSSVKCGHSLVVNLTFIHPFTSPSDEAVDHLLFSR
ncbi:ogr/Delta-like zinc finger family protein [Pseudomonas neuropathica]